ncbi:MAG TPA: hypothetical protein VHW23_12610 [Kofleriaceae bacterium]|jgi:hypothetical protein|nr:hypothetical protein [Kofleriaceae bacterium]
MTANSRLLVLALALAGCSSSSDSDTVSGAADTPLSGKVGSQSWTFQIGATDPFLSQGDGDFVAALYATSYTPCSGSEPTGPHLFVAVPKQPGTYPLSPMRNVTFVTADDDNLISLDGEVEVHEVTATTVTGGLRTRRDDGNDVNGQFQLTVCPEQ